MVGGSWLMNGDLQRKNILIRRRTRSTNQQNNDDGESVADEFQVSLVDFENAGWYPSYWEYFKTIFGCRWDDDWSEYVEEVILDPYHQEWAFCNSLFLHTFY